MFSDKSDFPKHPETWKLNRLNQTLSPIMPKLKIAWFYRIARMVFLGVFLLRKFFYFVDWHLLYFIILDSMGVLFHMLVTDYRQILLWPLGELRQIN